MTLIKYVIIQLRSESERIRHVTGALLPFLPLNQVEVLDAVERASLPPPEELLRQGVIHPINDLLPPAAQRLGQVACAMSHVEILRRHAASKDRDAWMVVFEDDVELMYPKSFTIRLEERLASLPPTADACYLHVYDGREDEVAGQEEVAPGVRRAHKMFATWAIAYRPKGAALLAAQAFPMHRAIDNTLSELVTSGAIEMYTCLPALVRSAGDVGPFAEHRRAMRSTIWLTR